jgi:SAM-dependent methyltransferase
MGMKLNSIVPFGRTLAEYRLMFNLTDRDLQCQILDIGAGPASFTAEMYSLGYRVTAIDPIYKFSGAEIKQRFNDCVDGIIEQVENTSQDWVWQFHKSPSDLRHNRELALQLFLADYDRGKIAGRYIAGEVPNEIGTKFYDLILCSHFLLLYSDRLSWEFHCQTVTKLLEHTYELRIFPLLTLMLDRSPYLDRLCKHVEQMGYQTRIVPVEYELQPGGNEMLIICKTHIP